jgi:hypothetical protein
LGALHVAGHDTSMTHGASLIPLTPGLQFCVAFARAEVWSNPVHRGPVASSSAMVTTE